MAMMMKVNQVLAGIRRFAKAEKGLVTVEWVALTAGMVVAAVAIGFAVMNNTAIAGKNVGGNISTVNNNVYGSNGSKLGN